MDSFAISEFEQIESEDYIMVEIQHALEMRDDLSDDDSYDYCDDVCSIQSSDQTPSICSEALGSVLTVPSVLLKDLDEAHEAAALAIKDSEEEKSVTSPPSVANGDSPTVVTDVTIEKKKSSGSLPKKNEAPAKKPSLSRTSNKKRRKQLKMMKKAQAAENAAKALAEKKARSEAKAIDLPKMPKKSTAKAKKATNSGRIKRVHPHVACATETLAAYREELRLTTC